jgi:hypothetical protein
MEKQVKYDRKYEEKYEEKYEGKYDGNYGDNPLKRRHCRRSDSLFNSEPIILYRAV